MKRKHSKSFLKRKKKKNHSGVCNVQILKNVINVHVLKFTCFTATRGKSHLLIYVEKKKRKEFCSSGEMILLAPRK